MALFGSKKNTKKEDSAPVATPATATTRAVSDVAHVLRQARITEKASMQQGASVYTFNVASSASKTAIREAVKKLYNVTPAKVRIVTIPAKIKRNMRTGRSGVKGGGKKAYVYLKKGETITIS